jgi:hypothetical protein
LLALHAAPSLHVPTACDPRLSLTSPPPTPRPAPPHPPAQLITGSVCKKTLGTSGGGLVHTTWIELGPDAARKLINNTQFTVNHWLLHVRGGGACPLRGGGAGVPRAAPPGACFGARLWRTVSLRGGQGPMPALFCPPELLSRRRVHRSQDS